MRVEPLYRRLAIGGGAILVLSAALLAMLARPGAPPASAPSLPPAPPIAPQPAPAATAGPAPTAPASPGGLRLHGVGAGAIISDAGRGQRLVALGREVAPGLVLERVGLDHVMLRSPDGLTRLDFAGASAAPAAPARDAPSADAASAADTLPYRLGLAPRRQDGQVTGHVLRPGASLPALERAGLRAGDVIVAVNGSRFDQERLLELPWTLANSEGVSLEVERNGQRMRLQSR